jgi:hypothetical protein
VPARLAANASAKSREARLPSEPPSLALRDFNSFKTGVAKSNVVLMMSDDIYKSIRCQVLGAKQATSQGTYSFHVSEHESGVPKVPSQIMIKPRGGGVNRSTEGV